MLSTGYGLGKKMTQIGLHIKDLSDATKHVAGPIKGDDYYTKGDKVGMPVDSTPIIVFDSAKHKSRYIKYYNADPVQNWVE